MNVRCPHCGTEYDVEKKEMYRYVKCEACGKGFVAGAATSLQKGNMPEEPSEGVDEQTDEKQRAASQKNPRLSLRRPKAESKIADESVLLEEKLRLTINPEPAQPSRPVPYGSVTAAEERVRMYDEMRRKQARQKMVRNFLESLILLLCLGVVVGCCLWWRSHANRVEKERIRLQAEAEAERIKQQQERDRLERERREKDRLAHEAERRQKEQEAQARRLAEERAEKEVRSNKERYHLYMMALKENNFDMFVKSVTNDMDRVGGELCYLLPSAGTQMPLFHVVYETNGVKRVFKLYEDGKKDEVGFEAFQEIIKDVEYLVAKGGTVHFRSTRKNPSTGLLPMTNESDPAETFFGSMSPVLKTLKPTYDELTFDVFFTPRGRDRIFVENLPFGCSWSRRNVKEAIEKNTSMNSSKSYGVGSRPRKFKRTVRIWNGTVIKQGIDGITYVPSSPPPERYRERYSSDLPNYNVIYRSRTVRYDNSRERWQTLYNKAQQEEAEEAAYYERQHQKIADRRVSAQAADEQRWQEKVDGILSNGVLSYKIRKAKIKD